MKSKLTENQIEQLHALRDLMAMRAVLRDWEGGICGKYCLKLEQILKGESPDLNPDKAIKDAYPLVLYFPDHPTAQEFLMAVREAYPNWSERGISA